MENKLRQAGDFYREVTIPDQLSLSVEQAIKWADNRREKENGLLRPWLKIAVSVAAVFILTVNTVPALAIELYEVPVLGELARAATVWGYRKYDGTKVIGVNIPKIQNTGNPRLEKRINAEIYSKIQLVVDDAEKEAQEYKKAFLETGGKEWDFIPVNLGIDYEVKRSDGKILSFEISETVVQGWASAKCDYYNIDLDTGKQLSLQDVLGREFAAKANAVIRKSIADWNKAHPESPYFSADEGGFTGISDNQPFYINQKGNPVIVFEKYAIAMGAMGKREFEIPR